MARPCFVAHLLLLDRVRYALAVHSSNSPNRTPHIECPVILSVTSRYGDMHHRLLTNTPSPPPGPSYCASHASTLSNPTTITPFSSLLALCPIPSFGFSTPFIHSRSLLNSIFFGITGQIGSTIPSSQPTSLPTSLPSSSPTNHQISANNLCSCSCTCQQPMCPTNAPTPSPVVVPSPSSAPTPTTLTPPTPPTSFTFPPVLPSR